MALHYITYSNYDTSVKTVLKIYIHIGKRWKEIYQNVNNGGYLYVVELWEDFLSLQFSTISKFTTMSTYNFIVTTNINSLNSGSYMDNNKLRRSLITRRQVESLFKYRT